MKDAYGDEFIAQSVPAYTVYPNLQFKVITPSYSHMLGQTAASYVYKVQPNTTNPQLVSDYNKIGLVSASAQFWSTGIQIFPLNLLSFRYPPLGAGNTRSPGSGFVD